MKNIQVIVLSALCAALPTVQTKCAAEADPAALMAPAASEAFPIVQAVEISPEVEIFDVKGFVKQVENGKLTDEQILPNLNRRNPPQDRGRYRIRAGRPHNPQPYICDDTPLIRATRKRYRNALTTFLRLGADLEKTEVRGWTSLMIAAQQGDCVELKMLLDAKANIEARDLETSTSLMLAAGYKYLEAVEILIEAKAEPNTLNKFKQPALTNAIRELDPCPKLVKFLLEAKANPAIPDIYGFTALVYAKQRKDNYPKAIETITELLIAATPQSEEEAQEAEEDRMRREELLANHRAAAEVKEENA